MMHIRLALALCFLSLTLTSFVSAGSVDLQTCLKCDRKAPECTCPNEKCCDCMWRSSKEKEDDDCRRAKEALHDAISSHRITFCSDEEVDKMDCRTAIIEASVYTDFKTNDDIEQARKDARDKAKFDADQKAQQDKWDAYWAEQRRKHDEEEAQEKAAAAKQKADDDAAAAKQKADDDAFWANLRARQKRFWDKQFGGAKVAQDKGGDDISGGEGSPAPWSAPVAPSAAYRPPVRVAPVASSFSAGGADDAQEDAGAAAPDIAQDQADAQHRADDLNRLLSGGGPPSDLGTQLDQIGQSAARAAAPLASGNQSAPDLDRFDGPASRSSAAPAAPHAGDLGAQLDRIGNSAAQAAASPTGGTGAGLDLSRFDYPSAVSPPSQYASAAGSGPDLTRFDPPPAAGPNAADGKLTDARRRDNAEIQAKRDQATPLPVQFRGLDSLHAMHAVDSGSKKLTEVTTVIRPKGIPAAHVILQPVTDVAFSTDRSLKFVNRPMIYRLDGETQWHVDNRITIEHISPSERNYPDNKFVERQTADIRTWEASGFSAGAPLGAGDRNGEGVEITVAHAYEPGQWADPTQGGKWVKFPKELWDVGFEPGPGGVVARKGITVHLGDKEIPPLIWGGTVRPGASTSP